MNSGPKNFQSAIDELESGANGDGGDLKARLEKELHRIEETLNKLKPHIEDIKTKVGNGLGDAKDRVEKEVQKNPWAAIGIVALVFFILGFLFSHRSRD